MVVTLWLSDVTSKLQEFELHRNKERQTPKVKSRAVAQSSDLETSDSLKI
jgi:hypothetical protein